MDISIHLCRNLQVWARRLKIAVLLLCVFVLHSTAASAYSQNSYHLYSIINFNRAQCPSELRSAPEKRPDISGEQLPLRHLYQYYNPHKSIFTQQPLRPLSLKQQLAMLDVFEVLGISAHNYDLVSMINLTQKKNLSVLTPLQLKQITDWREIEGSVSQEKACLDNDVCKEKTSSALSQMGMYNSQVPKYQEYDYTLFLGGSIQEMQWRMMMLTALFAESIKANSLDLGEIITLTCNRVVLNNETDGISTGTLFDVHHDPDSSRAKAKIDDHHELLLTETTGYQAIYYSLKQMSQSPEYFARFRETTLGYHPTQPVSYLGQNSFENKVYARHRHTFQLHPEFPEVLTAFFRRYPNPVIIETKMQREGETLKRRPTTKQTVKEWLKERNNRLSCKNPRYCKILAISNAPNAFYQHTAVLQALEESITGPADLTYELYTAGPGVSRDIPTNALLDNLTKHLYLEAFHPAY